MRNLKHKQFAIEIKAIDDATNTIEAVFSTAIEDRQGEIVDQKGWVLSEFLLNPVVLFAHDQFIPAVGKVVEVGIDEGGNLAGKIQFAVEENPLAKTLYGLYKGGYMRAFSVGFENLDFEIDQENEVLILRKNKLYELSCVNVPANALALAKSKGLDITPYENYQKDLQQSMEIQQKNLEKLEAYREKEGRVVSKKNRAIIEEAISSASNMVKSLKAVLEADDNEDKSYLPSSDKSENEKTQKVETPQSPVGGRKSMNTNRLINKTIRKLLKEKKLTNSKGSK